MFQCFEQSGIQIIREHSKSKCMKKVNLLDINNIWYKLFYQSSFKSLFLMESALGSENSKNITHYLNGNIIWTVKSWLNISFSIWIIISLDWILIVV